MEEAYKPIDCNFYDILEAKATLGERVEIVFRNAQGMEESINSKILDLWVENKQEYMKAEQTTLRLDSLIRVAGENLSDYNISCGF